MGFTVKRVLRRVLRRGSVKGVSRRCLEPPWRVRPLRRAPEWRFTPLIKGVDCPDPIVLECFLPPTPLIKGV